MTKLNNIIKFGLEVSDKLQNPTAPCYNPLAEFVPYVTPKEIVHSRIISDLLSPSGNHGEGEAFLKNFFLNMLKLDYYKYHDFNVIRERKVKRVLTEGGSRSIDILITYKDEEARDHAIIIENKLNHAEYQYLQLEDYEKSIEIESLVDRIVLMHDIEQPIISNSYVEDKYIYLYPMHLSEWIRSSTSNPNILSYAYYLSSLNNQNISIQNAKIIMKNLSLEEIKNLKKVVDAYNALGPVLMDDVVTSVQSELPFPIESNYNTLDMGWKGVCVKNTEDYKRNGVWVELFYPMDPADDDHGYDIYLYTYEYNYSKAAEVAEKCNYEFAGKQEGFAYFRALNGKYRYNLFPQETKRKELVTELVRLLNCLHE